MFFFSDWRPRGYISRSPSPWFLRRATQRLLFSIRGCHASPSLPQQKSLSYLHALCIQIFTLNTHSQTGRSKHYAFLEFDSSSVAQIVAETMDSYLLMGHLLRCEVIPKDKVHPELWVGANKKWKKVPTHRIERLKHDKVYNLNAFSISVMELTRSFSFIASDG